MPYAFICFHIFSCHQTQPHHWAAASVQLHELRKSTQCLGSFTQQGDAGHQLTEMATFAHPLGLIGCSCLFQSVLFFLMMVQVCQDLAAQNDFFDNKRLTISPQQKIAILRGIGPTAFYPLAPLRKAPDFPYGNPWPISSHRNCAATWPWDSGGR